MRPARPVSAMLLREHKAQAPAGRGDGIRWPRSILSASTVASADRYAKPFRRRFGFYIMQALSRRLHGVDLLHASGDR